MQLSVAHLHLPARVRFASPMSDEELMRFSAANEGLKIEREPDGEILVMTPTGFDSGPRNSYIIQQLGNWCDADGRGIFFDNNTGFTLPDNSVRSPDAAWLSHERADALPASERRKYAHVVPEFVIELVSENDSRSEVDAKMQMWMANGVQVAWLIDPYMREAAIYRAGAAPQVLSQPSVLEGDGPIVGFRLVMDRLWA
jgi:Uma2 family endonuclease